MYLLLVFADSTYCNEITVSMYCADRQHVSL